jgi:hypothetical protein
MDTKLIPTCDGFRPIENVTIVGAQSGRQRIKFDGRPSTDAQISSRFGVDVATQLHKSFLREPPPIKWFTQSNPAMCGFASSDGRYIALSDRLAVDQVIATALHEVRHLAHAGIIADDAEAELDSEAFAARWLRPTLRAYRATRGECSRVAVLDGRRPSGWAPHMYVRLTRSNGKVWQRDNRTTAEAWKELYT